MNDERWQNIISRVKDKFKIEDEGSEEKEINKDKDGKPILEKIESIVFDGPLGRIKLERTTKPLVIDKKTKYSQRIGGEVSVDYVYSDTEKIHKFKVYRYDEENFLWAEIDQKNFNL